MNAITTLTQSDTRLNIIDELGVIKAQIAELQAQEKTLLKSIKEDFDVGSISGDLFTATISKVEDRKTLDTAAAEAKLRELGVDNRWFSKHQKTVSGYTTVRVTARKSA